MTEYFVPPVVEPDPNANATDLLIARVKATPKEPLFALPTANGGWTDLSCEDFLAQVVALAKGFIASGIEPGDKVGFMCKTRYEWTLVDFALWFSGAIMVPIYETSSPTQVKWNLTDSGATSIILETADHFAKFDEIRADIDAIVTSGRSTSET